MVPRFNERFLLSLSKCEASICLDDELNILPISAHMEKIEAIERRVGEGEKTADAYLTNEQKKLRDLQEELKATLPIGRLVGESKTLDQATAVMSLVDVISEKSMKTTVSVTAGRG